MKGIDPSASVGMSHYTDKRGYNAIRAENPWLFLAKHQRVTSKPFGAYFTILMPEDPNFLKRVRLPKTKRTYRFTFTDIGDLLPLPGPRGKHVFYSPVDYRVAKPRQLYDGMA